MNIDAKNLTPGQSFIYNYAGGNRTVYRAVGVRTERGRTAITYIIPGSTGGEWGFSCAALSSLRLV